jgi:hypothetical protein
MDSVPFTMHGTLQTAQSGIVGRRQYGTQGRFFRGVGGVCSCSPPATGVSIVNTAIPSAIGTVALTATVIVTLAELMN